jgi:hypothetical protein
MRPRAEPALAAERRPAAAPVETEIRGHASRSGLFAINKLINRVAGGGLSEVRAAQAPDTVHGRGRMDDAEGEIPAFLRRQAN